MFSKTTSYWQQISLTTNSVQCTHCTDQTEYFVDKRIIVSYLAVNKRQTEKKLPKTSATISFFGKEDSLIVNNWKLSIEKQTVVDDELLLCSSPRNHVLLRVPLKLAHQVLLAFVLLLSNAVSQNLYRILAIAIWKSNKISVCLYTSLFIKFFFNKN